MLLRCSDALECCPVMALSRTTPRYFRPQPMGNTPAFVLVHASRLCAVYCVTNPRHRLCYGCGLRLVSHHKSERLPPTESGVVPTDSSNSSSSDNLAPCTRVRMRTQECGGVIWCGVGRARRLTVRTMPLPVSISESRSGRTAAAYASRTQFTTR